MTDSVLIEIKDHLRNAGVRLEPSIYCTPGACFYFKSLNVVITDPGTYNEYNKHVTIEYETVTMELP